MNRPNHTRTLIPIVGVVLGMAGMAWAAVPLYDWFCRVTGYSGTTQAADFAPDTILDQTVTVRFDASTSRNMPWTFEPAQQTMEIRIGETGLAFYEASNPTNRPVTGTASFNVTPLSVGGYFAKIECFCFTEQTLQPGETVMMPVTFFVDPDMIDDAETADIHTITLSYTFFQTEPAQAGLNTGAAQGG
ncbi:MAG: cytochrome c oxidase assembly protein [Pseudomonadota bacterium]